jgi:hypothetical protein
MLTGAPSYHLLASAPSASTAPVLLEMRVLPRLSERPRESFYGSVEAPPIQRPCFPSKVSPSTYVDDARHWADVYGDMLRLNESMVEAVDGLVGCAGNAGMNASDHTTDLWAVMVDGSHLTRVTHTPAELNEISWSRATS